MSRAAAGGRAAGRGHVPAALGIDLGTTNVKAALVGLDGNLLGLAARRYPSRLDPAAGRAEQDPEAWWQVVGAAARTAVATARQRAGDASLDVVAIGVDGHGPTLVAADEAGRAVRPAITWQDTRSAEIGDALRAASAMDGWSLGIVPAAAWLERHEPDAAEQARWYLNTWEDLGLRLTGRAASTHLAGVPATLAAAASAAHLDPSRLPPPIESGAVLGGLLPESAAHLDLPAETPVVAGLVDAHASCHGARLLEPGDGLDVGGAAGGFGMYWKRPISAAGSWTNPAPLPGRWLIGGAFAATGAALEWLRDGVLGGVWTTGQLIDAAAAVEPAGDGPVFLPYLAGERSPLWDPDARGAFVGLGLGHGRAHLTRAVLEAAALAIRHLVVGIEAAGAEVRVMRVAGGPAASDAWNHIKADVLGIPIEVPAILETAAVGSAITAAVGVGAHGSLPDGIRSMARIDRRIAPDPSRRGPYARLFETYLAIHPAIRAARAGSAGFPEAVPA